MSGPVTFEKTFRRDALIDIEKKYQKVWAEEKVLKLMPQLLKNVLLKMLNKFKKHIKILCHYGLSLHEWCFARRSCLYIV